MKHSEQQLLRLAIKTGALSPSINEMNQMPAPEDEKRLFEDKMSQMAYQAFSAAHPDLIDSIITFKVLDSEIDAGKGMGAFVLDHGGQLLYVPVIISDNQLKPFDMIYAKDTDRFIPLTSAWLTAVGSTSLASLGEGTKLPNTVATDVDIRNIVVPPTTGRHSYASVSPTAKLAAVATEPFGRRVHKLAQELPAAPVPEGSQTGKAPADGGFNPEEWATFNEHFQRMNGMTPGQFLDSGSMDLDTMSKMYKSHQKTWQMNAPQAAPAEQAPPQGQQMPQQPAMPPAMGGMGGMKTAKASVRAAMQEAQAAAQAAGGGFSRHPNMGAKAQDLWESMGRGAGIGGLTGGAAAARDRDITDVPNAMLRGAIGGAVIGPMAKGIGHSVGMRNLDKINPDTLGSIAGTAGAIGGGMLGIQARPESVSNMVAPSQGAMREWYEEHPPMERYASDAATAKGLQSLIKHAMGNLHARNPVLPEFLMRAPNVVKQAFARTLEGSPALLKTAADLYGVEVLMEALTLRSEKVAASSEEDHGLLVATKDTSAKSLTQSFGAEAARAYQGIALRGYHYKDTRSKLNLAVQIQKFRDFTDAAEAGVYNLYKIDGEPQPALVVPNPLNLLGTDRAEYPEDSRTDTIRMIIMGNGDYSMCTAMMGDQATEIALKGTPLFTKTMSEKKSPARAGLGCFVYKCGTHYTCTSPVKLSAINTRGDGTVTGIGKDEYGSMSKKFVIDAMTPGNRARRPSGQDFITIPASWKWMPLKKKIASSEFIRDHRIVSELLQNTMRKMGSHEAVVKSAGQNMYAVDDDQVTSKIAALVSLSERHCIHASAAEAMLKIAEAQGACRVYISRPDIAVKVAARVKLAQGAPMGSEPLPPAMGAAPPAPSAPPEMGAPPEMAAPPEPQMADPISMAFGEVTEGLQGQMEQLQSMLGVLQMVQQRAAELSGAPAGEPGGVQGMPAPPEGQPMTPEMAAAPEASMPPEGMDPSMQGGMPPEGMDPSMQNGAGAPGAVMRTEEPSAMEIQNQINPQFLQQSAQFADQGAFDAGAIGSLSQDPNLRAMGSQYAANLEDSLDDLGRTLLTLYMQESDLKQQLGDQTFTDLESQLRDTFSNLGKLVLSLTHNTAMLDDAKAA